MPETLSKYYSSDYYSINREKIGHCLIYFSKKQPISLTKALKLLFLLDETSVKETGVPITWLDYYAWERGPVANDVYE